MPDLKKIEDRIIPYLDNKPVNPYELCAATGLSFSQLLVDLKILEAAGKVRRVPARGRKSLWALPSTIDQPEEVSPVEIKPKKSKKSKKVVEDGEVE